MVTKKDADKSFLHKGRLLLPHFPLLSHDPQLCLYRAIASVIMVLPICGNVVQVPDSVFAPVRTLTANIALEMAYALDLHRSAECNYRFGDRSRTGELRSSASRNIWQTKSPLCDPFSFRYLSCQYPLEFALTRSHPRIAGGFSSGDRSRDRRNRSKQEVGWATEGSPKGLVPVRYGYTAPHML